MPGAKGYPIVGHALQLLQPEVVMGRLMDWRGTHGSRLKVILGYTAYNLFLTDPKDIEKVVNSHELLNKGSNYDFVRPWLGYGLLTQGGEKWYKRRRMLTPAFHFSILETFQHVFNEQSAVLVKIMREKLEDKENIEMNSLFSLCALDIISETAMGRKLNCQRESTPYVEAVLRQSQFIYKRWMSPWLQNDFIWSISPAGREDKANLKTLHDFTENVILERKERYALAKEEKSVVIQPDENHITESVYFSKKERFAFLDLLLSIQDSSEDQLTDADIREETDTFMFEGHDTAAAGLLWSFYLLVKNPEHQALVHSELDGIFGDDTHRSITSNDLTKMKYLELCIKESLRLYPSVAFMSRKVKREFRLDSETLVPPGVDVAMCPYLTHRDPNIYPEPEKFLPTRHTPENSAGRHPYAYIPFSAGLRNCIGQRFVQAEMKTVLANIFRHFQVQLADPNETVVPLPEIVMRPNEDIRVALKLR
ncbi:unnamed protein product [Allacma fusca]|uniref:Cytochrome P450 n=1 Tax=Allacma fusca TaxID=39272 RepID=A0A8J2LTQ5_9HEXA|nr:unnamed protein product [Allacma fusca]